LAYAGADDDGYITSFSIASDGSTITEVAGAILQHDDKTGKYNSLVQVDSDTFALAYAGHQSDGYISTFDIDSNGDITPIRVENTAPRGGSPNLEHDQFAAQHNSLVQVDSDTFALAYAGNNQDGYISTFTIDSDGDITPILIQNYAEEGGSANLEHDTARGQYNSLVQVDSDTYALAYAGDNANGTLSTFTISSDGSSIDKVSSFLHDTPRGIHSSLVQVDSDTFALAYASDARIGYISTFTISQTITEEDTSKNKCYDCEAPRLVQVQVGITSNKNASDDSMTHVMKEEYAWNFPINDPLSVRDNDITKITANPGDEIEITLNVIDDKSVHLLPTSGIYTNFMERPNDMNLFFVSNFDENHNTSTSFYEWNRNHDDVAYDYADTVTWRNPDISYTQFPVTTQTPFELLNDELVIEHFIISFKMKFTDSMRPSQVWVSAADYYGQTFKVSLPLTLEILGDEPLDFTLNLNQEVLGYFNEPVLLSMLYQWSETSEDASELSSILGVNGELPQWTANLATWTVEEKITLAEMIIAIEHVINQ
jgi:6-phosphogluconolactonase (cycloisomerase 2 family)